MSLSVPISIGDIDNHSSSSSSSTRTSVNLDNLTLEETLNYSVLPSICMIVFENILEKVKPNMVRENPTDIQIGKSFEVIIREIRSRIPIYNRVDANRTRKRRDQAITTYMKHIRANKEKFPEYIKHH